MWWSPVWWFGAHVIAILNKTQTVSTPVPSSHPYPLPDSLLLLSVCHRDLRWPVLEVAHRLSQTALLCVWLPLFIVTVLELPHNAASEAESCSNVRDDLLLLFNYCSQCHPVKGAVGKETGFSQQQKIELTLLSGCWIMRWALCGHLQDREYLRDISEWPDILNL